MAIEQGSEYVDAWGICQPCQKTNPAETAYIFLKGGIGQAFKAVDGKGMPPLGALSDEGLRCAIQPCPTGKVDEWA